MKLKFANDNGNSEQDMFINDVPVAQPNVYAHISRLPNMDEVNVESVLRDIHNNLVVAIEGQSYYVGNKALRSGSRCRSIEVGVDNNKVTSHIVYINTLAHLAGFAVAETYRQGESLDHEIECEVDMATAIPVSYYSKKTGAAFAQQFMGKTHLVTVFVGPTEVSVRIRFDFVKVIPEGVTAAHAFLSNESLFDSYNRTHDEILSMTKQIIYKANNEIDVVAVYGGGSILMRSMIEERLQDFCSAGDKGIKVLYIEADKAVMLEAEGLNEFVHSELFDKLKEFSKKQTA